MVHLTGIIFLPDKTGLLGKLFHALLGAFYKLGNILPVLLGVARAFGKLGNLKLIVLYAFLEGGNVFAV